MATLPGMTTLTSSRQRFDDLIAEKVMGWVLWSGDWYTKPDSAHDQNLHNWRAMRLWRPTEDAYASQLVWIKCLARAREMGYELSNSVDDDGRYHINGDHPVAKRLLVVDPHPDMAICRFACLLFDLQAPAPYDHNPGPPPASDKVADYPIVQGLQPPVGRPVRRDTLMKLLALAKDMKVGDAAVMTLSESQTFRVILAAMGFECVTDAYRCQDRRKLLAFKLDHKL